MTDGCFYCEMGSVPYWFSGRLKHDVPGGSTTCSLHFRDIKQDDLAARKMRVLKGVPPNLDRIAKVLPAASNPNVLFCYGDIIYSPGGLAIPPWLVEHEKVHSIRQGDCASSIEAWWEQYITSKEFRFKEELPAHIVEYAAFKSAVKGDGKRKQQLRLIAQRLAGPLYSVGMVPAEARHAILEGKQNA